MLAPQQGAPLGAQRGKNEKYHKKSFKDKKDSQKNRH